MTSAYLPTAGLRPERLVLVDPPALPIAGLVASTQDPTERRYEDVADAIDAVRAAGAVWSEGDMRAKAIGLTQINEDAVRAIYLQNGDWDAGLGALLDPAAAGIPTRIIRGDPAQGGLISRTSMFRRWSSASARTTSSRSPARVIHLSARTRRRRSWAISRRCDRTRRRRSRLVESVEFQADGSFASVTAGIRSARPDEENRSHAAVPTEPEQPHGAGANRQRTDDEMRHSMSDILALNDALKSAGAGVYGGQLDAPSAAKVVRPRNSKIRVTDGPYLEAKEHVAGFYIVEAADLDGAHRLGGEDERRRRDADRGAHVRPGRIGLSAWAATHILSMSHAPPAVAFDLWTNLERQHEWIGGVTAVVDVTGLVDVAGTSYTVMFGRTRSPTEVLEADRPRVFAVHFGNWILRGQNRATFEPEDSGTRVTVRMDTEGLFPAIMAGIFSLGSWKGSFRGELAHFARLAAIEGRVAHEAARDGGVRDEQSRRWRGSSPRTADSSHLDQESDARNSR